MAPAMRLELLIRGKIREIIRMPPPHEALKLSKSQTKFSELLSWEALMWTVEITENKKVPAQA